MSSTRSSVPASSAPASKAAFSVVAGAYRLPISEPLDHVARHQLEAVGEDELACATVGGHDGAPMVEGRADADPPPRAGSPYVRGCGVRPLRRAAHGSGKAFLRSSLARCHDFGLRVR